VRLNGATAPDTVSKIRAEITRLQAELRSIATAPLPGGELRERARAYVAQLAEAGRPVLFAEQGKFEIRWPPGAQTPIGTLAPGSACVAAALFPDAMLALIEDQINKISGAGINSRERPEREAQIRARIHDLEAQEEAIIEHDEIDNNSWGLTRRVDADAFVVLGCRNGVAHS
jgi:hypothetical protein